MELARGSKETGNSKRVGVGQSLALVVLLRVKAVSMYEEGGYIGQSLPWKEGFRVQSVRHGKRKGEEARRRDRDEGPRRDR